MKKGPQVIGDMFRESLDLAFVAHNDTYKRHRALRVARADQRFSGTYQCKVSSFVDEDFQQKEVLVYSECLEYDDMLHVDTLCYSPPSLRSNPSCCDWRWRQVPECLLRGGWSLSPACH